MKGSGGKNRIKPTGGGVKGARKASLICLLVRSSIPKMEIVTANHAHTRDKT